MNGKKLKGQQIKRRRNGEDEGEDGGGGVESTGAAR